MIDPACIATCRRGYLPVGALVAQHHAVGALEDGVRHVGDLDATSAAGSSASGLSSICVAATTGPGATHFATISFCHVDLVDRPAVAGGWGVRELRRELRRLAARAHLDAEVAARHHDAMDAANLVEASSASVVSTFEMISGSGVLRPPRRRASRGGTVRGSRESRRRRRRSAQTTRRPCRCRAPRQRRCRTCPSSRAAALAHDARQVDALPLADLGGVEDRARHRAVGVDRGHLQRPAPTIAQGFPRRPSARRQRSTAVLDWRATDDDRTGRASPRTRLRLSAAADGGVARADHARRSSDRVRTAGESQAALVRDARRAPEPGGAAGCWRRARARSGVATCARRSSAAEATSRGDAAGAGLARPHASRSTTTRMGHERCSRHRGVATRQALGRLRPLTVVGTRRVRVHANRRRRPRRRVRHPCGMIDEPPRPPRPLDLPFSAARWLLARTSTSASSHSGGRAYAGRHRGVPRRRTPPTVCTTCSTRRSCCGPMPAAAVRPTDVSRLWHPAVPSPVAATRPDPFARMVPTSHSASPGRRARGRCA